MAPHARVLALTALTVAVVGGLAAHKKTHDITTHDSGQWRAVVNPSDELVVITPVDSSHSSQRTIVDLKKGITVYLIENECYVSRTLPEGREGREEGEGGRRRRGRGRVASVSGLLHLLRSSSSDPYASNRSRGHNLGTLYVSSAMPRERVASELGPRLAPWCSKRATWRLSRRRPSLPSFDDYLREYAANQTEASTGGGHIRPKRRASRRRRAHRSEGGKNKKGRRRGKKSKKGKTKSLKVGKKVAKLPPRLEFPAVQVPKADEDSFEGAAPPGHVVLQEEPYLSPSFVRREEDGQGFRHYGAFYRESQEAQDAADEEVRRRSRGKIDIPDKIFKDGQVFYRYDAEEDAARNRRRKKKDQSKRSHRGSDRDFLRDDTASVLTAEQRGGGGLLLDSALGGDLFLADLGASRLQTQAQMGGGTHAASAGAQAESGHALQVQGSATHGGYFSAQAQSQGLRGTTQTQVQGSQHGVQGSAMSQGSGHQSHVQIEMGPHSVSAAQVNLSNGSLSSVVASSPLGGSAGSGTQGLGATSSHAQMDFLPAQRFHGAATPVHTGQGAASASSTSQGSSSVASLTGDVPAGSYLGTALSSVSNYGGDTLHESLHIPAEPAGGIGVAHGFGNGGPEGRDIDFGDFDLGEAVPSQPAHGIAVGQGLVQSGYPQEHFPQDLAYQGLEDINGTLYDYPLWFDGTQGRDQERQHQVFDHDQLGHERLTSGGLGHDYDFLLGGDLSQGSDLEAPRQHGAFEEGHPPHGKYEEDMLVNILETVHQPEMHPPPASFPDWSGPEDRFVDRGGLLVGAGIPPRESEVEQSPRTVGALEEAGGGELLGGDALLAPIYRGGIGSLVPGQPVDVPIASIPSYYDYGYEGEDYDPRFLGQLDADFIDLAIPPSASGQPAAPATTPTPPPLLLVHQVQSTPQVGGLPPAAPPLPSAAHPLEGTSPTQPTTVISMPAPQPGEIPASASQPETQPASDSMQLMPLVPRGPGTAITLPGSPPVNVLAVAAPERRPDGSLVSPRPARGRPMQPGDSIPGVPGFRVPDGFRGRLVIDSQPPPADAAAASIAPSGGQIMQQSWRPMGGTVSTSATGLSPGKSWGAQANDCGFYSVHCSVVFGPFEEARLCRPVRVAAVCCC